MPVTGYLSKHDGLKYVKIDEPHLIAELKSLQYCAASLLSRVADCFEIDGSPILLSTRICWRHFKTKARSLARAGEIDHFRYCWPDCLEHGTTLSISEQREACYGAEMVYRLIDAVTTPTLEEETITLPDGTWANAIIFPPAA